EDFPYGGGDVGIFAWNQARGMFEYGDPAAETAEQLRELEADITAADDDEMLRQKVDVHHRRGGPIPGPIDAGDRRNKGAASHIEKDFFGRENRVACLYFPIREKTGVRVEDSAIRCIAQPLLHSRSGFTGDLILAGFHFLHVDAKAIGEKH